MTTKATIVATAIACLIVGAGAGYVGASQLRSQQQPGPFGENGPRGSNFQRQAGQGGQQFGSMGGRVIGSVQSVSDGRLTIQTPDNNSQIILVNGSTAYQKMTEGSVSDVVEGTQIIVMGEENPDGSTTASSIQIVPEGTNLPFGGGRPGGPPSFNQQ